MIGITSWMYKFLGALLFTTMTGSIALMLWDAFGRRLEEYGYFRWYCAGLRMVAVLFLFPAIYAVEACCPKLSRCFGIFLAAAPEFPSAWLVLFVLWASGALAMCVFWASGIWAPWLEQTEFSLRSLETAVV